MTELYNSFCLDPNEIKTMDQILYVLEEFNDFKKRTNYEAVVVLRINRHMGGTYVMLPKVYVEKEMKNHNPHEYYEKCFPRSFYENLKNKV